MNIQLTILQTLSYNAPRLLPEGILLSDVRNFHGQPAIPKGEFDLAMRALESQGHVLGMRNQDTGNLWKITDAGKARLIESGI